MPLTHKIGFAVQDLLGSDLHTIGRGARAAVFFVFIFSFDGDRFAEKGVTNGNGMSHSALRAVRGHHDHVSKLFHYLHEGTDSRGSYAVVIGH